jgi:DNA-binding sugar fermentation-stimulating protein
VCRGDCYQFKPSKRDPLYAKTLYEVQKLGVEIISYSIKFIGSKGYLIGKIPCIIEDIELTEE